MQGSVVGSLAHLFSNTLVGTTKTNRTRTVPISKELAQLLSENERSGGQRELTDRVVSAK